MERLSCQRRLWITCYSKHAVKPSRATLQRCADSITHADSGLTVCVWSSGGGEVTFCTCPWVALPGWAVRLGFACHRSCQYVWNSFATWWGVVVACLLAARDASEASVHTPDPLLIRHLILCSWSSSCTCLSQCMRLVPWYCSYFGVVLAFCFWAIRLG